MELKLLIRNTSHLASTRMVKFILGLVRAKISALFLGKTGVGIISQINFTTLQFSKFTTLGMNDGLVKQLSSSKDQENFIEKLSNSLKSYIVLVSLMTIIVTVICLLLSEKLTLYFFGDIKYLRYYFISIVALPILILNSVSYSLLRTFKEIKLIARVQLITTCISFLFFVPIVYFFKLNGAVLIIILTFFATLVLNHVYSQKKVLNKFSFSYRDIIKHGRINKTDMSELAMFAGFGLTIGIYQILTNIVGRSIVISKLGVDSIGLYAPNRSWGGLFTGMILPTIYHYLYPRFAEVKSDLEIKAILNDSIRLISFCMVPFLFGGIAFRKIAIPLFYSDKFIDAALYLPGHFIGIFFMMLMHALGMVFTPTGRIKIYVLFNFIMYTLNVGVVYYFVPRIGLYGWMLKFIISPILFFIVFYTYLSRTIKFSLLKENYRMLFYLLFSSLILFGFSEWNPIIGYIVSVFLICVSWFLLKQKEKKYIILKLRSLLKISSN